MTGRTGETCGEDVNECDLDPCVHGQCINIPDTYLCICDDFWTGTNCDNDYLECSSSPCKNNATCVEVIGGPYLCSCAQGQ